MTDEEKSKKGKAYVNQNGVYILADYFDNAALKILKKIFTINDWLKNHLNIIESLQSD